MADTYKLGATGAVERPVVDKFSEFLSVKDFGAKGDNANDDSDAIQGAINEAMRYGGAVLKPPGVYRTTKPLVIGGTGVKLFGAGMGATVLNCVAPNVDAISIANGAGRITISDMTIDSTVVRTGGAGVATRGTINNSKLENLQVLNQYDGYVLGATDFSIMEDCFANNNYRHGVLLTNSPQFSSVQWTLRHVLSQMNDGDGFNVFSQPGAGLGGITLGGWYDINCFGNRGYGISVNGLDALPIYGFRLNGFFSGANGKESLFMDTYADQHNLTDFYIELDGMASCGRNLAQAATGNARGVLLAASNRSMRMTGGLIKAPAWHGLVNRCSESLLVSGVRIEDCGQRVYAQGIYHNTPTGRLVLSGVYSGNTGAGMSQKSAVYADDCSLIVATGYDFSKNAVARIGGPNPANATLIGGF